MYPFLPKKLRKLTAVILCTAVALAIPTPVHQVQAGSGTYGKNDVMVLAKMIHGEARGESYVGKVAVGAVILNRVEDKKFPDSVYSVCFQPGAFDAVRDGQYYLEPNQDAINAAKAAINGWDPLMAAYITGILPLLPASGIWSRRIVTQIGKHVFGV